MGEAHNFKSMKHLLYDKYVELQKLYESPHQIPGITTGFKSLDKITAGLQQGELTVIAARPGMGKSSFLLNLAANASLMEKDAKVVAIFSLAQSSEKLTTRLLASESRVDMLKMKVGNFEPDDWRKLAAGTGKLSQASIFINDDGFELIDHIRKRCETLKKEQGHLGVIMVDDIDLLQGNQRTRCQGEVARELKELAMEFEASVLVSMSLPRSVDLRQDKRPVVSDLLDADVIEQYVDVMMLVYRPEVYGRTLANEGVAQITIAKQNNGPTGKVGLRFHKSCARFECLESYPQESTLVEECFELKFAEEEQQLYEDSLQQDVFFEKGDEWYD